MVYVRQGHAAVSLIVKTISLVFNHKYRRETAHSAQMAVLILIRIKRLGQKPEGGHR
jgi:hypothetical protein